MTFLSGSALATGLSALLLSGCYSLQPVRGVEPEVGNQVAVDITDAGRVALGGVMGPEIGQVQGTLMEKEQGTYVLAVRSVRFLRGGEQVWSGENVRILPEYIGTRYLRRFSASRSIALGVLGIGGFAVFLATQSLDGRGDEPLPDPEPEPPDSRLGRRLARP